MDAVARGEVSRRMYEIRLLQLQSRDRVKTKTATSEEIHEQTSRFLAGGGFVNKIEIGVGTGTPPPKFIITKREASSK